LNPSVLVVVVGVVNGVDGGIVVVDDGAGVVVTGVVSVGDDVGEDVMVLVVIGVVVVSAVVGVVDGCVVGVDDVDVVVVITGIIV